MTVNEYINQNNIGPTASRLRERMPELWSKVQNIPIFDCRGISRGGYFKAKFMRYDADKRPIYEMSISLNRDLSQENQITTFWHELSHALIHVACIGKQYQPRAHGLEWQHMMQHLGQPIRRCTTSEMSAELAEANPRAKRARPFIYKCMDCGYEIPRTRITLRMTRAYHRGCGRKLNRGRFSLTVPKHLLQPPKNVTVYLDKE